MNISEIKAKKTRSRRVNSNSSKKCKIWSNSNLKFNVNFLKTIIDRAKQFSPMKTTLQEEQVGCVIFIAF